MRIDNLTAERLHYFIPNVLAHVDDEISFFDRLLPFIESAKLWLEAEFLGEDDFLSEQHNELALKIIVKKALADAIPSLDLIITPSGMAVINTDNMAPASKERVERLIASLRDYVKVSVPLLLEFCHSYPQWLTSGRGQYFCASFFDSPKLCDDRVINVPFAEARSRALQVEAALAEHFIGRGTLNAIRDDFSSRRILEVYPLVSLIRGIILNHIVADNFSVNVGALWFDARRLINELNYYPTYKAIWTDEMGESLKDNYFVNDVKGGFYF